MYAQSCEYGTTFPTYVLGDDSVFGIPVKYGEPSIENLSRHALRLGLTMNPTKAILTQRPNELHFLRHTARFAKVNRPVEELFKLLVFTEDPVSGPPQSLTRLLGLTMDSALSSPELVRLYQYAQIRARELELQSEPVFPHEYANWLQSIVGLEFLPADLSLSKIWIIT